MSGFEWTPEGKRLLDNVEKIGGENQVPLNDLFSPGFMRANSSVQSFEELIDVCGFKGETAEDFENIPDNEWDKAIKKYTEFESWGEMQKAAGAEWIKKQLNS